QGSLLERLTYFWAVKKALSLAAAVRFHDNSATEPIPDWGRLAFQGMLGTELGPFATVDSEVVEARELWLAIHGRPLPASDVVRELNRPAERCITVGGPRVLAWGTWAASLQ